jgi:hypothetical protein
MTQFFHHLKSHRFLLPKDLPTTTISTFSARTNTYGIKIGDADIDIVAIAAVPAFLAQQKFVAKWTLNHFPCKCMFSSA